MLYFNITGSEYESPVCGVMSRTLWMSYVKVLVCSLLRSVLGVLRHRAWALLRGVL